MKKILFVDDESQILHGIRRLLRPMRDRWDVTYEDDAARAMQLIEDETFDVVVSDMKMPKFGGIDVLRQVQKHSPAAVRIGLSGFAEAELALEAAGVVHQFFAKPCELKELIAAIQRIELVQQRLNNADLQETMASISDLPALPGVYTRIMQEASSPSGSLDGVGEIIQDDLAITTKLLSIVNSPFFGLANKTTNMGQAASLIGFDGIRAIVVAIGLFQAKDNGVGADMAKKLLDHSIKVGAHCTSLCRLFELSKKQTDVCVLAGMLHDIGKLVIHSNLPEAAQTIQTLTSTGAYSELQAESTVLGYTHMEVGAYLLSLWGFTNEVVEAAAFHHHPADASDPADGELDALTIVHLANALAGVCSDRGEFDKFVDLNYLSNFGITPDSERWQELLQTAS